MCVILPCFVFSTVPLSLSRESAPLCSPSMELKCSYRHVYYVRIEEFVTDSMRFSLLTSIFISNNPDFEEEESDGLYTLRVARIDRYNGTRYRCHGFGEDLSVVVSEEWTLIVPGEYIS